MVGSGCPRGGWHSRLAVSPTATTTSWGFCLKSSRSTRREKKGKWLCWLQFYHNPKVILKLSRLGLTDLHHLYLMWEFKDNSIKTHGTLGNLSALITKLSPTGACWRFFFFFFGSHKWRCVKPGRINSSIYREEAVKKCKKYKGEDELHQQQKNKKRVKEPAIKSQTKLKFRGQGHVIKLKLFQRSSNCGETSCGHRRHRAYIVMAAV